MNRLEIPGRKLLVKKRLHLQSKVPDSNPKKDAPKHISADFRIFNAFHQSRIGSGDNNGSKIFIKIKGDKKQQENSEHQNDILDFQPRLGDKNINIEANKSASQALALKMSKQEQLSLATIKVVYKNRSSDKRENASASPKTRNRRKYSGARKSRSFLKISLRQDRPWQCREDQS